MNMKPSEHLRAILDGSLKCSIGICGALCDTTPYLDSEDLLDLMERWPEFSGDRALPVSPPNDYFSSLDKWSDDNPYGAARRRLAWFLIEKLEEQGL